MAGFDPDTLTFLRDLAASPDREFFADNRDRYEAHWLAPARAFVEQAVPRLAELSPGLTGQPRVHGSILHPRQDVRFGRDRALYRDHVGLLFWEGDRSAATSVLFLRVHPDHVTVGAGARSFDRTRLAVYRQAVVGPAGGELVQAVDEVAAAGWSVHGRTLATGPRDVASDDPQRQALLCHSALWAADDLPHPGVLSSSRFVGWCVRRWAQQLPVHRWLTDHVP